MHRPARKAASDHAEPRQRVGQLDFAHGAVVRSPDPPALGPCVGTPRARTLWQVEASFLRRERFHCGVPPSTALRRRAYRDEYRLHLVGPTNRSWAICVRWSMAPRALARFVSALCRSAASSARACSTSCRSASVRTYSTVEIVKPNISATIIAELATTPALLRRMNFFSRYIRVGSLASTG